MHLGNEVSWTSAYPAASTTMMTRTLVRPTAAPISRRDVNVADLDPKLTEALISYEAEQLERPAATSAAHSPAPALGHRPVHHDCHRLSSAQGRPHVACLPHDFPAVPAPMGTDLISPGPMDPEQPVEVSDAMETDKLVAREVDLTGVATKAKKVAEKVAAKAVEFVQRTLQIGC